ncbi:hypothetical protein [Flavobacterium rhamnosiphilum]|uniref:hypothetical protein n=1 Tax=Flavobacterium rhamnosiphilum TaxID=2541724 RepID=UPI0014052702|nr:hypothetical protein [Flavobacterium rhamnosiphilum]
MKDKKSFKDLVKQMEFLQENQQGKLKGGFPSYSSTNSASIFSIRQINISFSGSLKNS